MHRGPADRKTPDTMSDTHRARFWSILLLAAGVCTFAGITLLTIRVVSDLQHFRDAVSELSAEGWLFLKERSIAHADNGRALEATTVPAVSNYFGQTAYAAADFPCFDLETLEATSFAEDAVEHLSRIDGLQYVSICTSGEFTARTARGLARLRGVTAVSLAGCAVSRQAIEELVSDGEITFLRLRNCEVSPETLQLAMDFVETVDLNDGMYSVRDIVSGFTIRPGHQIFVRTVHGFRRVGVGTQ